MHQNVALNSATFSTDALKAFEKPLKEMLMELNAF